MKVNIEKYPEKAGKQRKVSIKIEKHDLWDFDGCVGLIILEWLKQFRAYNKHGIPATMPSFLQTAEPYDRQMCFDFYMEANPPFSDSEKEWNEIIDKMIWSFDEIINETNCPNFWEVEKIEEDLTPEHLAVTAERVRFNHRKHEEYQNKVQEGMDLFCKYYGNLGLIK